MTLDEIKQEYGMSKHNMNNIINALNYDVEFKPEALIPFTEHHRNLYRERYGDAITREDFIDDWIKRNADGEVYPIIMVGKSQKNVIFVVAFERAADAALFKMEFCIE